MKNNYKLWTIISLIIVFSAGLITGVLLNKHIFNKKHKSQYERTDRKRTGSTHYPTLDQWAQELELSAEQKEKIQEIFKNNEERFKALRKNMNENLSEIRLQLNNEIKSVLTEEQKVKYETMIDNYRSGRKREMEKRNKKSKEQNKGERR